jgi:hypothetical protein
LLPTSPGHGSFRALDSIESPSANHDGRDQAFATFADDADWNFAGDNLASLIAACRL